MRIQFDANQEYQLDAVGAVCDLFEGQPSAEGDMEVSLAGPSQLRASELGYANALHLSEDAIERNLKQVQKRNRVGSYPTSANRVYTVEMETGTGKTYVYLRTIFELNARYGWKKFIIVVPSVAIREGVLKSIELMRDHFRDLYANVPFDTWIYDSAQASRLRSFATNTTLQILILNIQAFDKRDINVIHQESDRMSGYRPLQFIQECHPIVILDEPQNMASDTRKNAIASLNPLFELRYSATHKELVNLVYRLDPVRAYDLGLVKRIEVSSVLEEPDFNRPYILLKRVTSKLLKRVTSKPIAAVLEVDIDGNRGPARREVRIKDPGTDLFEVTGGRELYRDWILSELDYTNQQVTFTNGVVLRAGEATGASRDAIMQAQIREAIKCHFEKERKFATFPESGRMKVLTLFFIDRVANYAPEDGKIRKWFEAEYRELAKRYKDLNPLPVEQVHSGYFAQDRHGPKDTRGNSKADDEAYELIMRDKERLLSLDEPLRFIFSHSALREGWDNPNVFQICTLNETRSEIKKRQEIGRGLRLPVRADGTRLLDSPDNILTVVANESYEDFARALQAEIREECGVEFEGRVKDKRDRRRIRLKKGWKADPYFLELWARIRHRTRYNVRFETAELVTRAAKELRDSPRVSRPRLSVRRAGIEMSNKGVVAKEASAAAAPGSEEAAPSIPDLLTHLQKHTGLTRPTIAQILIESQRLEDAIVNPQKLLTQAADCINRVLSELLVSGIEYERIENACYEQRVFEDGEIEAYVERLLTVNRSIYREVQWESKTEKQFAADLDAREDIKLFIKLPRGFTVETPIGTYNPDWAIVWEGDTRLYLVRETKASLRADDLRPSEQAKVDCGYKHFAALEGVNFDVARTASDIPHRTSGGAP